LSLCLIVETDNCVWLSGDTAVSEEVNGKCLRMRSEMGKSFAHKNAVFMCGGSVRDALTIRRYIETLPKITAEGITLIADKLKSIVTANRLRYPSGNVKTVLLVALLDTGRVCGITEANGFLVESPTPPRLEGFRSICCIGAVDNDGSRGCELADKYFAETQNVHEVFSRVYHDFSSNGIGGRVDLFQLDIENQKIIKHTLPLQEQGIEYVDGNITMNSGSINWANINESASTAYKNANAANQAANEAYNRAIDAESVARRIAAGEFAGGSFINGREIFSPTIYSNDFRLYPRTTGSQDGAYSLWGYFGGSAMEAMRIAYHVGSAPTVVFSSPSGGHATWNFAKTYVNGEIDFSHADVTGIEARFA